MLQASGIDRPCVLQSCATTRGVRVFNLTCLSQPRPGTASATSTTLMDCEKRPFLTKPPDMLLPVKTSRGGLRLILCRSVIDSEGVPHSATLLLCGNGVYYCFLEYVFHIALDHNTVLKCDIIILQIFTFKPQNHNKQCSQQLQECVQNRVPITKLSYIALNKRTLNACDLLWRNAFLKNIMKKENEQPDYNNTRMCLHMSHVSPMKLLCAFVVGFPGAFLSSLVSRWLPCTCLVKMPPPGHLFRVSIINCSLFYRGLENDENSPTTINSVMATKQT